MQKVIKTCIFTTLLLTNSVTAEFNFDVIPEKLTAYYTSPIQPISSLKSKLTANGFKVLAATKILDGKTVVTITNEQLRATNSYMATIQLLVNKNRNEIRVQNPSYLGAAYLQGNYNYGQFKETLHALESSLGIMHEVADKITFSKLKNYCFMFGMPNLKDDITIAENRQTDKEITALKAKKYILYSLQLENGAMLIGHKLEEKTNNFLKKIGETKNSQLLPYEAMIENGKVSILDPKYYLALSLPLLSMSDFMQIATTPDQIVKDIKKAYQ